MGGPVAEGLATAAISASLSNQPGRAIVNVRDNYLVVDSVPPLGGPNLEVNPLDLLLAAQGTCGTLIIERAAIDNDIPLEGVKGTIEVDFNQNIRPRQQQKATSQVSQQDLARASISYTLGVSCRWSIAFRFWG